MKFNEDTRVKIPAILHLARLGYGYLSLKSIEWNRSNNIVPNLFSQILNNQKQNQELATLRDWLLPMLMNGQVTVTQ